MASYGDYNGKIVIDENKDNLDTKNMKTTSAMKKLVVKKYTSSEMRKGPYLGFIVKVFEIVNEDEEEGFFSFLDFGKTTTTVYKVRVPELDAHIPEPDIEEPQILTDNQYIDMHPTYYVSEDIGDTEFVVGDKVWVERDDVDVEKNIIIKSLEGEKHVEGGGGSGSDGARRSHKRGSGGGSGGSPGRPESTAPIVPELPPDATEEQKWNSYSHNSGNPYKIDIITKNVNGQKVTLSRTGMKMYEDFQAMWAQKRKQIQEAGLGDVGDIKYIFGEAFRVWTKKSGNKVTSSSFKSGLQHSIHNYGGALDMVRNSKYAKSPFNKYVKNYNNFFVHCAQLCGFKRFGIGYGFNHMDNAISKGGHMKVPSWWVYYPRKHSGKIEDKKHYYKNGYITEDWLNNFYTPPDLRNWDYLSVRYGPGTGGS